MAGAFAYLESDVWNELDRHATEHGGRHHRLEGDALPTRPGAALRFRWGVDSVSCRLLRVLRPKSGLYVINKSTLITDAQVKAWTAACARQIREHVAPAYGRAPVKVAFLTSRTHAPAGAWVITVLDDADQAGDLGWHTEDASGRIYGRVFARPCLDYGVPVSTTLSHEIVETFCDPDVDQWRDTGRGYSVAYEACDPVEGDSYEIDGTPVSDFVTPGWYTTGRWKAGSRTRWLGTPLKPFTLAPGGYVVRRWPDGSEDQAFGATANRAYIAAKRHQLGRADRRITVKETTP
jgi:hypothetical protein